VGFSGVGPYQDTRLEFEAYCRERWGMTRSNAYKLIEDAESGKMFVEKIPQINRGQARELAKVEPDKREEVVLTPSDRAMIAESVARI